MNELFELLASLDVGKASFLVLTLLVLWREREAVKTLREIQRHVAESKYLIADTKSLIKRNTAALEAFAGLLRRKGLETRKEEITHER